MCPYRCKADVDNDSAYDDDDDDDDNDHDCFSLRGRLLKRRERGNTSALKHRRIGHGRIVVGGAYKDAIVFFIPASNSIVECLAVKIIQSESHRFFRDKVCRRQWVFVFLIFLFWARK